MFDKETQKKERKLLHEFWENNDLVKTEIPLRELLAELKNIHKEMHLRTSIYRFERFAVKFFISSYFKIMIDGKDQYFDAYRMEIFIKSVFDFEVPIENVTVARI